MLEALLPVFVIWVSRIEFSPENLDYLKRCIRRMANSKAKFDAYSLGIQQLHMTQTQNISALKLFAIRKKFKHVH